METDQANITNVGYVYIYIYMYTSVAILAQAWLSSWVRAEVVYICCCHFVQIVRSFALHPDSLEF